MHALLAAEKKLSTKGCRNRQFIVLYVICSGRLSEKKGLSPPLTTTPHIYICVSACVCVCVRERERVCVCVRERERECVRERENVCVCACVRVCM